MMRWIYLLCHLTYRYIQGMVCSQSPALEIRLNVGLTLDKEVCRCSQEDKKCLGRRMGKCWVQNRAKVLLWKAAAVKIPVGFCHSFIDVVLCYGINLNNLRFPIFITIKWSLFTISLINISIFKYKLNTLNSHIYITDVLW